MTRVHHKYEGVYLFLVVPWGCLTCADPEIDLGGGGGGPGPTTRKQSGQLFFKSSTYFTDCRGGPMVLLHRKHYFSKDPEGVQHFTGGGGSNFF